MQGGLAIAKSGRLTARHYFTDIRPICPSSTTVTWMAGKAIEFGKKRKIRAITPLKIIQGHRGRYFISRKFICDFLLVINSNWNFISYRFGVIAVQILDTLCFWATLQGLRSTYDVHRGLIRKPVVDFLSLIIESLDATAEALRAKIGRKSAISLQRGQFDPKFQVECKCKCKCKCRFIERDYVTRLEVDVPHQ